MSSQLEMCRNHGSELEECQKDHSSGQVGYVQQEEVLT